MNGISDGGFVRQPLGVEPIDGSVIGESLNPEIVTQGELQSLLRMAYSLLDTDGVRSTVDGMPATVTRDAIPVVVGDKDYFGRVFLLDPLNGEKTLPAIAFDETPDVAVLTSNPNALRFQKAGDYVMLVTDNPHHLDPEVDDAKQVELVKSLMLGIAASHARYEAAIKQERRQAEEAKRQARANRVRRLGKSVLRSSKSVAIGTLATTVAAGAVAAAIYGISKIDIKYFDDYHRTLEGGTELVVGTSGHPEYSTELYGRKDLETSEIPNIGEGTSGTLGLGITLREMIIYSSEEGKNCNTGDIARVPLDERVVAWTDFTDSNGKSRADELDVSYQTDKVKVCWNGEELDDYDDPRVVLALRRASESKPR